MEVECNWKMDGDIFLWMKDEEEMMMVVVVVGLGKLTVVSSWAFVRYWYGCGFRVEVEGTEQNRTERVGLVK